MQNKIHFRTGAAIQHMVMEGFSQRRGARIKSDNVTRVAIVITDGRSQDNVTEPAMAARNLSVNMFAIGVTDHVLASELESISGSPARWFYVDRFKDLDTRLRSLIQKAACPSLGPKTQLPSGCNPVVQTGCNRALNEICVKVPIFMLIFSQFLAVFNFICDLFANNSKKMIVKGNFNKKNRTNLGFAKFLEKECQ